MQDTAKVPGKRDALMRTYAKCMTGLEDVWTARMDDTLHLEDGQADGRPGESDPE